MGSIKGSSRGKYTRRKVGFTRIDRTLNVFVGKNCIEKLCTKCKEKFPLNMQHFYRDGKGVYSSQCNFCRSDAGFLWRRKNNLVIGGKKQKLYKREQFLQLALPF